MIKIKNTLWFLCVCVLIFTACGKDAPNDPGPADRTNLAYEVLETLPHDTLAFTQGLLVHDGFFYESTGLYGRSSLRKVEIQRGKVLQKHNLSGSVFAEGLAYDNDRLVQLTWRSGLGFVYDVTNFTALSTFRYSREGWGLTFDGADFIMSDGSDSLFFLDKTTFKNKKNIAVKFRGEPVDDLNELEFIDGQVWANIWHSDSIAIIDPADGEIVSWLDLTGLLAEKERTATANVLNGIAWDEANAALYVTGKLWPKVYRIKVF